MLCFFSFFSVYCFWKLGSSSSQKKTFFHKIVSKYKQRKEKSSAADKGVTLEQPIDIVPISDYFCVIPERDCVCETVLSVVVCPWFGTTLPAAIQAAVAYLGHSALCLS